MSTAVLTTVTSIPLASLFGTPRGRLNSPAKIRLLSVCPARVTCFLLLLPPIRTYWVQTRVDGSRVKHCDTFNVPPAGAASFPDCRREDPKLTVVHGKLDTARSSLVEVAGQTGLREAPVGVPTNFSIVAKDSFGNTRCVCAGRVCE